MFATDGRIPAFDFVVLTDDKGYFPTYAMTPVVRKETLDKNPKLADILNALSAKLDDATMARLNASVDVDKKSIEEVASGFLKTQSPDRTAGSPAGGAPGLSRMRRDASATRLHPRARGSATCRPAVVHQARRCLLDLVGVAASGRSTALSRHRARVRRPQPGRRRGGGARLLFDGRRASPAGAAFAGASTIDALRRP